MDEGKGPNPYYEGESDELRALRLSLVNERDQLRSYADALNARCIADAPDAERYRYLRNRRPSEVLQTVGDAAGCWIDCEVGEVLTLLTGDDADVAIDAAMSAAPAVGAA